MYTFSANLKEIDYMRICAENGDADILMVEVTDDSLVYWMFRKAWLRKAPQDMILGKYTNVARTLEGNPWSKEHLPNDWVSFITGVESRSIVFANIAAIRAKMAEPKIVVKVTPI